MQSLRGTIYKSLLINAHAGCGLGRGGVDGGGGSKRYCGSVNGDSAGGVANLFFSHLISPLMTVAGTSDR